MHTNVHEHTYTNTLKLTETEAFSHMQQPIYAVVHKRTISLTQMQLHTQSVEVCICVHLHTYTHTSTEFASVFPWAILFLDHG